MADESRTVIVDVETDIDVQLGKVNKEIDNNRKALKELKKDYGANATEISKLERQNQDLSKTKRELIKDNNAEKGSLNALRRELANQVAERNSLNISTAEGKKKFDEMNVSIKALNDQISGFEQAGGDFRRNVGNYPKLLGDAVGGIRVFGTSLSDVFKVIVANPIALLVTAIAGLVKVFSESQAGAEFFRKTSAALNTGLSVLKDIVEAVGVALIDAFSNPKQALTDLVTTIKDGVVNYFTNVIPNAINTVIEGFGLLGKAAQQIFAGEFSAALNTASEASAKLLDGVTDLNPATFVVKEAFKAAIPAIKEVANEIERTSAAAFDLENRLIANEKALADQKVVVAQSIASQKELNLLIENQTASYDDRIAAAEEFARVEKEQIDESIRLQEERIAILKAQNDLTNSTEEDLQRVRDAEIELANLRAASFEREVTNQNKLNTVLNQQRAEQQKLEADALKKREQQQKKEAKDAEALAKFKSNLQRNAYADLITIFGQGEAARKAFALAEIGVDTAKAIASLTAASEANPANAFTFGGAGIAQFAAGIIRIGANIANAKNVLSSSTSGFGGGAGGGGGISTTAVQTSGGLANVNASLLSQFSQAPEAGAAQVDAFGNAVANQKPPQVSVVDINEAQNARAVKVTEASLS